MLSESEVEAFITRLEGRVAPVEKAVREAWWRLATTGTEEAQADLVAAGMKYNRLFAARDEYAKVRGYYEERESLENGLLRRQVEIVYRIFASRHGDRETLDLIEELEARAKTIATAPAVAPTPAPAPPPRQPTEEDKADDEKED